MLADPATAVPNLIRGTAKLLLEEIRLLEARIAQLERELAALARLSPACTTLLSIPGIGLLTATALVAATSGDVSHFKDARHFSSWFGLTPKEYSSGNSRYLGRISKKGDRYLRMLLTHGARSVLRASKVADNAAPTCYASLPRPLLQSRLPERGALRFQLRALTLKILAQCLRLRKQRGELDKYAIQLSRGRLLRIRSGVKRCHHGPNANDSAHDGYGGGGISDAHREA